MTISPARSNSSVPAPDPAVVLVHLRALAGAADRAEAKNGARLKKCSAHGADRSGHCWVVRLEPGQAVYFGRYEERMIQQSGAFWLQIGPRRRPRYPSVPDSPFEEGTTLHPDFKRKDAFVSGVTGKLWVDQDLNVLVKNLSKRVEILIEASDHRYDQRLDPLGETGRAALPMVGAVRTAKSKITLKNGKDQIHIWVALSSRLTEDPMIDNHQGRPAGKVGDAGTRTPADGLRSRDLAALAAVKEVYQSVADRHRRRAPLLASGDEKRAVQQRGAKAAEALPEAVENLRKGERLFWAGVRAALCLPNNRQQLWDLFQRPLSLERLRAYQADPDLRPKPKLGREPIDALFAEIDRGRVPLKIHVLVPIAVGDGLIDATGRGDQDALARHFGLDDGVNRRGGTTVQGQELLREIALYTDYDQHFLADYLEHGRELDLGRALQRELGRDPGLQR
jgi:hypothetical protein